MRKLDLIVPLLFSYFALLHLTVERNYCYESLDTSAQRNAPLGVATRDFSKLANPLFYLREEWLRIATCISAYGFLAGGALTTVTFVFRVDALVKPTIFYMGAKAYGLFYYHYMEFVSAHPPPAEYLVQYWAAEGPYLFFVAYVLFRLMFSSDPFGNNSKKKRN